MLSSKIEDIDASILNWLKEDLELSATTNEGWKPVPIFWQTPERAFQVKERTGITKDPTRKGGFQAHLYSEDKNGRTGRMILAKQIVQDKTRNFAVANNSLLSLYNPTVVINTLGLLAIESNFKVPSV